MLRKSIINHSCLKQVSLVLVLVQFSEQLWLFNGQVEDSTAGEFFTHLTVQSMCLHRP